MNYHFALSFKDMKLMDLISLAASKEKFSTTLLECQNGAPVGFLPLFIFYCGIVSRCLCLANLDLFELYVHISNINYHFLILF